MTGRKRLQAGDTIVEVMIAIVVISTVLAGAFFVTRTSLKHVRDSEEHAQALKLVQAQIELLRAAASKVNKADASVAFAPSPSKFCFDVDGTKKNGSCVFTPSGSSTPQPYNLYIINADNAANTYQATAQWDNISGGAAQVQLSYRVVFAGP